MADPSEQTYLQTARFQAPKIKVSNLRNAISNEIDTVKLKLPLQSKEVLPIKLVAYSNRKRPKQKSTLRTTQQFTQMMHRFNQIIQSNKQI